MRSNRSNPNYNPDEFEHEPTAPHPETPTDDTGQPVHPDTGEPICGLPKKNAHENRFPYCVRIGHWVRFKGVCFEHLHRLTNLNDSDTDDTTSNSDN